MEIAVNNTVENIKRILETNELTTLEGHGITNAYTKTEVEALIESKPSQKTLKAITDSVVSINLESDKHYTFAAPTTLTITGFTNKGNSNSVPEYTFEFTTGATATTLNLPVGLRYAYYVAPVKNSTYMVSIYNGVVVMLEVTTR